MRPIALALAAVLTLSPSLAAAQLGGLVKRNAEKAAEKAAAKAVADKAPAKQMPAPTFDDEVLELTAPRVDQVVRGLKAWDQARATANVPAATRAFEASVAREQEYANRYSEQRHAHREKNREVGQCREEVFDAQREANQQQIDRRMANIQSDPARMQALAAKASEWSVRLQAVMAGGDTVAARTALIQYQREMAKAAGVEIDDDSTKADAKCGKPAPAPAWLAAWDSTEVETRRLAERVREADGAGEKEAAAASGLTTRQFAVARERIESFVNGGGMGFSRSERSVLTPRKAELKAYFPAN